MVKVTTQVKLGMGKLGLVDVLDIDLVLVATSNCLLYPLHIPFLEFCNNLYSQQLLMFDEPENTTTTLTITEPSTQWQGLARTD